MLLNHLRPHLCRKRKLSSTIYQQDLATKETIALCQKIFRDSPDLSPLDYYLWNKIRQNVYNQKPANIHELKTYIQRAIEEIKQEELFNSIENIKHCAL